MVRTTAALIAITAHCILAQPQFEVVSVKPADPKAVVVGPMISGGPGTNSPGHVIYRGASLTYLLMTAYQLKDFQLSGPKWMDTARFYIDARLPTGTTKDDLHAMLRSLLVERFGVAVHREEKEMPAYDLLVSKHGIKMTPSAPAADDSTAAEQRMQEGIDTDSNGFPIFPPGGPGGFMVMNRAGRMMVGAAQQDIASICDFLSKQLGEPVKDGTALSGKYDFHLQYAVDGPITLGRSGPALPPPPSSADPAPAPGEIPPSLATAIVDQLGLRLERGRAVVEIVVVDSAEKTPAAN
jgi:uncharacterized protein (TIGR03435 family)